MKISTDDLSDFELTRTRSQSNQIIWWFACKSSSQKRRIESPSIPTGCSQIYRRRRGASTAEADRQGRQSLTPLTPRRSPSPHIAKLSFFLALLLPLIWRQFSVSASIDSYGSTAGSGILQAIESVVLKFCSARAAEE